jgi:hypothetical protein
MATSTGFDRLGRSARLDQLACCLSLLLAGSALVLAGCLKAHLAGVLSAMPIAVAVSEKPAK